MLNAKETDIIEFKSIWKDEYLKTICGLANAHGGHLFVGVDDSGKVSGIADPEKLLEEIPNKVTKTKYYLGRNWC